MAPATDPAPEAPPQRAFEVVLAWVDDRILTGDLDVGEHLPAERDLAHQLGVSRAAVREAVRTLQAQGVVRSSVGAGAAGGTVITAVPSDALSRLLRLHVALANFPLLDVIEVRIALERLSVRLAVAHATADDLARLRGLLDEMNEPGISRAEFNDRDTAFHVALATAAGNRLATDLTVAIRESMRLPILDRFRRLQAWSTLVVRLRHDHEEIYRAVVDRDADAAERHVEDHIRSAWRSLTTVA